jgi:hypothetical protein
VSEARHESASVVGASDAPAQRCEGLARANACKQAVWDLTLSRIDICTRIEHERLLSARAEQRVDLPATLGELPIGPDTLLADLQAADANREPRWAGDDVGPALSSDGSSEDGRCTACIGVEPRMWGRGTATSRGPRSPQMA